MWYQSNANESDNEGEEIDWKLPQLLTQSEVEIADKGRFVDHLQDGSRGVGIFGTVPPPKKLDMTKVTNIAVAVAEEIRSLNPDAVIVYDIQDEVSRDGSERPFPFFQTHEPRMYANMLKQLVPDTELIVYRALLGDEGEAKFAQWVTSTYDDYAIRSLVIVGGQKEEGKELLSVPEASEIAQHTQAVVLGGVVIPERHRNKGDEHIRVFNKTKAGAQFFNSQVVYNADLAIWMLKDYDILCKEQGVKPVRIIFTFAPFGSERTVQFMSWLGIEVPLGTVKRVLSRPDLRSRVAESMDICYENWKRILEACKRFNISVPLGVSVEAVSKSRMEQLGAGALYQGLKHQLDKFYSPADVFTRMLSQDGNYFVMTENGRAVVSRMTMKGPQPFGTIEPGALDVVSRQQTDQKTTASTTTVDISGGKASQQSSRKNSLVHTSTSSPSLDQLLTRQASQQPKSKK